MANLIPHNLTIKNNTNSDIHGLENILNNFYPYAQKRLGFNKPVSLNCISDLKNAEDPLGRTAYYDPNKMEITLYIDKRHVKDLLRSFSHELVHHTQNCNGQFENAGEMGEGYTQNNEHMREMERQAYEMGNLCFRDW